MFVPRPYPALVPGTLAALLALIAASAGLVDLDLYRPMTPDTLIPGTVSQDLMSLSIAVALLAMAPRLRRTGGRLWLIWLGGIGYLAYAYAIYAFEAVVNPLYLIYIAVLGLSLWAIIGFFVTVDRNALRPLSPPRRLTAVLFGLLVVLFLMLWLSILLPAMATRLRPDGTTIFVLDLSFVLPLLTLCAVLLWRGRPMGDLLAVPLLIKAGTIGLSVLLGTLLGPRFGLPLNIGEVATYAVLGLLPLALVWPWMRQLSAH